MDYFRVVDDSGRKRWYLDEPLDSQGRVVDARDFSEGRWLDVAQPLTIPIHYDGPIVDFTLGAFDMPVVKPHVAEIVAQKGADGLQRIPAMVAGHPGSFEVLNLTTLVDCIDESASEIEYWPAGHPTRGGMYRTIGTLRIATERASRRHMLRPRGWSIALLVSDELRRLLIDAEVTGISFVPAT